MITRVEYLAVRQQLLQSPEALIQTEQRYMDFLVTVVRAVAPRIAADFDKAIDLWPFWKNYAPRQRGRAPTGTSIPWLEVGETAIGANVVRSISQRDSSIHFPGLPSGADIRFITGDALVHFDIKMTGPNDRADEIVASPNQISGDGSEWDEGVVNSPVTVQGQRAKMIFQPELPPFYVLEGKPLLCLTYFLKGVYTVDALGKQPLDYLEMVCVPNGLLAFDGPRYGETPGLFIPGKDEKSHRKKRTRVRMGPLSDIAAWRRAKVWQQV